MTYPTPFQSKAMCVPKVVQPGCVNCTRYRPDRIGIEGVVIDATVVKWDDGMCPMKVSL